MTEPTVGVVIRRAIGGDADAIASIIGGADATDSAIVLTMAALLGPDPGLIERAWAVATTGRDRQVVAIARARLAGDGDLVDALAREHLVDHPDSYVVSWIASDDTGPGRAPDPT